MANEFKVKNGLITPTVDSNSYKLTGEFIQLSTVTGVSTSLTNIDTPTGYPYESLTASYSFWQTPKQMYFSRGSFWDTDTYNVFSQAAEGDTIEVYDSGDTLQFSGTIASIIELSPPNTSWGSFYINLSDSTLYDRDYLSAAKARLIKNIATISTSGGTGLDTIIQQLAPYYSINGIFFKSSSTTASGSTLTTSIPQGTIIPVGSVIGTYDNQPRDIVGIAEDGTAKSKISYNPSSKSWSISNAYVGGGMSESYVYLTASPKPSYAGYNRSTIIGAEAGKSLTTGYSNTAVGMSALWQTTTGSNNVAIGDTALYGNTVGESNTAIGMGSAQRFTNANSIIAIGKNALVGGFQNSAGVSDIIAIGRQALGARDGSYNIGIGAMSLFNGSAGVNNIAIGHNAGQYFAKSGYTTTGNILIGAETGNQNWSGGTNANSEYCIFIGDKSGYNAGGGASYCTYIGAQSGYNNYALQGNVGIGYQASYGSQGNSGTQTTTLGYQAGWSGGGGNYSVSIGYQAGYSTYPTYGNNVYIGYNSGYSGTTANGNTFVGYYTGRAISSGVSNTLLGNRASQNITTGNQNISMGDYAGNALTTGTQNVIIGSSAGGNISTGSYNVIIGAQANTVSNLSYQTVIGASFIQKASIYGIIETQAAFSEKLDPLTASSSASGTITMDVLNTGILYYRGTSAGNWTLNLRGNSSTTFNNAVGNERTLTVSLMVTNGATAYYQTGFQIDGVATAIKWQGGTAPSSGNANSVDIYTITVVKTGTSTYTAFGSMSKFA